MKSIQIPEQYNYIASFLTLGCNLHCPFCINTFGNALPSHSMMTGEEWIAALNRISSRPDLPITLQGGEPSLHPDFFRIISGIKPDLNIDLLTNLQFDIDAFMAQVPPERLSREAPYASIRVSYHPGEMALNETVSKVARMLGRGYSVGVWAVDHPGNGPSIDEARELCARNNIDFRLKEFLGEHDGAMYGTYRYPGALTQSNQAQVDCSTNELIIGPSGDVFRCHADLYEGREPIGNISDPCFEIDTGFRTCDKFGFCNPCDIKVKTNRFQEFGHTSVEILGAPGKKANTR